MRLTSVGSALGLLFGRLGCHGDEFPTQGNPGPNRELAITVTTIGTLVDADGYVVAISATSG